MILVWAVIATGVACLAVGYVLGSEVERYRNNESALGSLAEKIEEKVND
jgi:F0F1-type ATP synthase membrane subunit c/vacuolar-type H+-ATPase subunit K